MAHPCFECGGECYCSGDIDDIIVAKTPRSCEGCGCWELLNQEKEDWGDDDDDEEDDFIPCSRCDGHPACEDFGCAFEHGLGHIVQQEPGAEW